MWGRKPKDTWFADRVHGSGVLKFESSSPRSHLFLHGLSVFPPPSCSSIHPIARLSCIASMQLQSDCAERDLHRAKSGIVQTVMMQRVAVNERNENLTRDNSKQLHYRL